MPNAEAPRIVVSGLGVTSAIGQGQAAFTRALLDGRHRFDVLRRPGRQLPVPDQGPRFIGAEIDGLALPDAIAPGLLRTASWSAQVALATLHEAWHDAALDRVAPERIGLIVGGSNVQQRDLVAAHDAYRGKSIAGSAEP